MIFHRILLRMRNVSDKRCRENQNTYFEFRSRQVTDDNMIWHMCISCWVTKSVDTHSEYVMYFHDNSGYANVPEC